MCVCVGGSQEGIAVKNVLDNVSRNAAVFQLNYRDEETGVEFEYSIPKDRVLEANPNQPYTWIYGAWTGCSQECGDGEFCPGINQWS